MDNEWGWTSYRATGWVDKTGRKQYIAHFRMSNDLFVVNWTSCQVRFTARHPHLALKTIAFSGRIPAEFADHQIN